METWLEMLRRHHNYALGQRFDWLRRTRCQIDRCSLVSEPIGEIPDKFPGYNFQAGELGSPGIRVIRFINRSRETS